MSQQNPALCAILCAFLIGAAAVAEGEEPSLPAAALKQGKAATVLVDLGEEGSGSGFLVHPAGLFITNRHVGEKAKQGKVQLVLNSGEATQRVIPARVVLLSQTEDLALLKTDERLEVQPLPLADEGGLEELAPVVVFGYPFGKMLASSGSRYPAISINAGRISSLRRDHGTLELIQLDAATNPGNSGGPLLRRDGKVCGVIVSGIPGASVNFAIPVAKIRQILAQSILSIGATEIPFAQRAAPHDFEVEIVPLTPVPADAEVSLQLQNPGGAPRTFPAAKKDGKWRVTAAPIDPAEGSIPLRLRLTAVFGRVTVTVNLNDRPLEAGGRHFRLSEVREVVRRGKDLFTTLQMPEAGKGEPVKLKGKVTGLPILKGQFNGRTLNLEDARRLEIGAYDSGSAAIRYELVLASKGRDAARVRGVLSLLDPPSGLEPLPEEQSMELASNARSIARFLRWRGRSGLRVDPFIDLERDSKPGSWERRNDALFSPAAAEAWCALPVIPPGTYSVRIQLKAKQPTPGEFLVLLPVGQNRALLRLDGVTHRLSLELSNADEARETSVALAAFEQDKVREIQITVWSGYGQIGISASVDAEQPLSWSGKPTALAPAVKGTVRPDGLAIGQRQFAVEVQSMTLDAQENGVRVLRELPGGVEVIDEHLSGYWPFDAPASGQTLEGRGPARMATVVGTPQIGPVPQAIGRGAMKLGGEPCGFQLEQNFYTSRGPRPERTVSMWVLPSEPFAKDQRQYLYDEGGGGKGITLYLENGFLFAGGWDTAGKWPGTWLKVTGVKAGVWNHLILVNASKEKDPSKAFAVYLNGEVAAAGLAHTLGGTNEPITIGTRFGTAQSSPDEPKNPAIVRGQFSGLLDEVMIYNGVLNKEEIQTLAGGRFTVTE